MLRTLLLILIKPGQRDRTCQIRIMLALISNGDLRVIAVTIDADKLPVLPIGGKYSGYHSVVKAGL